LRDRTGSGFAFGVRESAKARDAFDFVFFYGGIAAQWPSGTLRMRIA
jgi:hypothetical protein